MDIQPTTPSPAPEPVRRDEIPAPTPEKESETPRDEVPTDSETATQVDLTA